MLLSTVFSNKLIQIWTGLMYRNLSTWSICFNIFICEFETNCRISKVHFWFCLPFWPKYSYLYHCYMYIFWQLISKIDPIVGLLYWNLQGVLSPTEVFSMSMFHLYILMAEHVIGLSYLHILWSSFNCDGSK